MQRLHGVDSEIGRLRTVLVHRPGAELRRITPRNGDRLLFDRVPWVSRAQQEHDTFTQALREAGVEVLYLTELLQDALEYAPARHQAVASVLDDARLGDDLRGQLHSHLDGLDPETLSQVLIAGLTRGEFRSGRGAVYQLLGPHDFVIDPLPNLLFTRDSSVWLGDSVAITSQAPQARRGEARLVQSIYGHHPRFAGSRVLYQPDLEPLEGGDVVLLARGVIAVGTGGRTTPAGVERLARRVFDAGFAHTVLAVPIEQRQAATHLDTICTMVDADTVVMHPAVAYTLTARSITPRADGLRVSHPQPFLEAAALAMGIDRLRVIGTGLDPVCAGREQWDDGGNTLAIAPRLAVSYERNVETNARLEAGGIEVIRVPGSELGSGRGGPRCMSCPVSRDPVSMPDRPAAPASRPGAATAALVLGALTRQAPAGRPDAVIWSCGPDDGKVPDVELNVSSRSQGDHTVVIASGEIDLYTAPRLHRELVAVLADDRPARVVVDMSGVEFCDSTGMNVLLSSLRRARERGGQLELAAPRVAVRKILQVTGLDSVFTVLDDSAVVSGQ